MNNEKYLQEFFNWIEKNYYNQLDKMRRFCSHKKYNYSPEYIDEVFQETIKLVANRIIRKGKLKDMTTDGIDDFFFISFTNNLTRDSKRSFFCKRDGNINDDNGLNLAHESFLSSEKTQEEKINKDALEDFCAIRILEEVEAKYGNEVAHAFAQKYLNSETYSKVIRKNPEIQDLKKKLLTAKEYIKEKYSRKKLNEEFKQFMADISLF